MDDPSLPAADHDAALDGLARLNAWSFADRPFRHGITRLLPRDEETISILDLAAGSGDLITRLARSLPGGRSRIRWMVADISDHALERCRSRAEASGLSIETHRVDAVKDELPAADIVTCSLFLHHLEEDAVTAVLRNLHACARLGGVVCDLRRSGTGLVLAAAASRLATRSHVVHFDAVTSVRAAFTEAELRRLATDAGITAPRLERAFPQRMRLSWRRHHEAST
ncbi:MAG: methyltransferase domain-containing protein [Phycisphaera sp.]|nr:methyltransferase domain-containing protein [Phycisphaera sp.]